MLKRFVTVRVRQMTGSVIAADPR